MIIFVLTIITLIFAYVIYWCKSRLNYFKNRNIPYLKSFPLIGAFTDAVIGRKGLYDCTAEIYNNPKLKDEKFFGAFIFHKPALFINDPEIIKQILIKDFNSFSNHLAATDVHDPIGSNMLFFVKDPLWRNLRKKMTPFFTSAKLKSMFNVFDKTSEDLVLYIQKCAKGKSLVELDVKEEVSLFTMNCLSICAFGVDADSFNNPKNEFIELAWHYSNFTIRRGIEFTGLFLLPEITKFFNFKLISSFGYKFLNKIIPDIINEREKSKIPRNDLIDTLIQIKNSDLNNNEDQPFSMDQLMAQAAIFIVAGYETSSSSTTFLLYELAKNLDIQGRVRDEIKEIVGLNAGKITYEVVMKETTYLHQALLEALRIYPILPFLDRECTNPNGYSLQPYSDFVIPYKMPVLIPIYGLHLDEKYFPDPLKFDPDRFSPENIHNIPTCTNLPFGTGNRSCIGERFALMQTKIAIIKILLNYRVELTEQTPRELIFMKNAMILQPENPIVLKFVENKMEIY